MYTKIITIELVNYRQQSKQYHRKKALKQKSLIFLVILLTILTVITTTGIVMPENKVNNHDQLTHHSIIVSHSVKLNKLSSEFSIKKVEYQPTTESINLPTEEAITTEEPISQSVFTYADCISMPSEDQEKVVEVSERYNIPPQLLFSQIWRESGYNANAISPTNDYGYAQINKCNFNALASAIAFDINNPCEISKNLEAQGYLLREWMDRYHPDSWHSLLIMYNRGYGGAQECWSQGVYSIQYSRDIINYAEENFQGLPDISNYY